MPRGHPGITPTVPSSAEPELPTSQWYYDDFLRMNAAYSQALLREIREGNEGCTVGA